MHRGGGGGGRGRRYVRKQPQPTTPSSSGHDVERRPAEASSSSGGGGAAAPPPASSKALVHPLRPGFGTAGRKCTVRANHFAVTLDANKTFFHYDVKITPEVAPRSVNRVVIGRLVDLHQQSELGGRKPAYDGRKSMFTAGPLPFKSKRFRVILIDEDRGDDKKKERAFEVEIRLVGRVDLHHLQQFLQGIQRDAPQEIIRVLDVVLRETPSKNLTTVARSFFASHFGCNSIDIGLECWLGYFQSLRPTQMGLSLNIDVSAAPFYKPIPVMDFVRYHLQIGDAGRHLTDTDQVKIKKALRGVKVETTHKTRSRKQYKITGITSLPTNQLMFQIDKKGTKMSVIEYFKVTYNETLDHVTWPCLQAGSDKRPIYLPMELCRIVGGQRYSKKFNEQQAAEILKSTCKPPSERENNILQMVSHKNDQNDDIAKEFGITVSQQLVSVQARILPPPALKYHESGKERMCTPNHGQWNMKDKKMVDGGTVNYWACLNFSRQRQVDVRRFCDDLVKMCRDIGMDFHLDPLITFRTSSPHNAEAALRTVQKESANCLDPQGINRKHLQLLIVILPESSGLYGRIKKICETELDIVSQCCLPRNVRNNKKQFLGNLALKINVKVGGRNTVLVDVLHQQLHSITDEPTIIFGADVTHPSPGEDSSSSIAAVVASMDWPHVSKYRASVSAQSHREEMIQHLFTETKDPEAKLVYGGMIRELLIAFHKSTNEKAKRIIFYRDGVSEGQFNKVLLYEMSAIKKACASLEDNYRPKVTFIVVQKRHHTRFFPNTRNRRDCDISGNVLPGTVVEQKICHPQEFDFYLCSHAGIKGTSRPTHYHVLWDENGFTADELQKLTHYLCYTYARCTRSISIVPPAYYAHLAAFRARFYSDNEPSDSGSSAAGQGSTRQRSNVVRPLPELKENVKNVMFFC